jgi:nucleoside-diphosphate kinase
MGGAAGKLGQSSAWGASTGAVRAETGLFSLEGEERAYGWGQFQPAKEMPMETTLIILKPDAVQRRFENKGLQIVGAKLMQISGKLAETHYEAHKSKPFYPGLVRFMTSSPVLVMAVRGVGAIGISRNMMGATFGSKAAGGTIRGDFGVSNSFNLIHGSDSPEAAAKELGLFFKPDELIDWTPAIQTWVYDLSKGTPE